MRDKNKKMMLYRFLVHAGALLPAGLILWAYVTDTLTVNPIQDITFRTGKAALILLIFTLAVTPLNTLFGFRAAVKFRRTLGLYTFFYASAHFLIFIGLDYGFNWDLIQEAIFEKRYALVGFLAGLIMLPLAVTSTRGWMKRLGKKWKRLHQLIYIVGILVTVHYVWLVKSDIRIPLLYGGIIILLLIARIPAVRKVLSRTREVYVKRAFGVIQRKEGKFSSRIQLNR
jgi:sulfoxide reductase heme-binding subunit YedZ